MSPTEKYKSKESPLNELGAIDSRLNSGVRQLIHCAALGEWCPQDGLRNQVSLSLDRMILLDTPIRPFFIMIGFSLFLFYLDVFDLQDCRLSYRSKNARK